ncbi:MAG TPA: cation:proton antiporter [Bacteroidales bacterium]|nr:cation:proton antiporter [Bacteroidales bacterium]HOL98643.1 cation:proton antiporter [Bacteroidales bacterium]
MSLPLEDPILIFSIILAIILFAPIILNKLKIPYLLGLIIAGAIIGPNAFNLIARDSGMVISGTAGLLYIMFLAGLEIDMAEFKKNSWRSFVFGMYTFLIPMGLGTTAGYYLLGLSIHSSILLASMFASHTLIAYPIISKMGVAKNKAVNIAVGGTVITDTLALLVLAVIIGMQKGEVTQEFWVRLSVSVVIFSLIVIILFPILARWFFKKFDDNITQFIFVFLLMYLGGILAEIAGVEAIIGAFLTGLALNRLIPRTSPLMNRVEFVGNAIFIPFFLISVGMLIDYRAFFTDFEIIKVGGVMIIVATYAKYIAAWLTQKTFRFSADQRRVIFGLSNAQAAATLAAVIVGYNFIIGYTPSGEPIRLFGDSILNGTILMILFTCTIASFSAQKGAKNLALLENISDEGEDKEIEPVQEKILISVSNPETVGELINLAVLIKSKRNKDGLYALNIVSNDTFDGIAEKQARKLLEKAARVAAGSDNTIHELLRYDVNIVNGINSVVKEHRITDMVLGIRSDKGLSSNFIGNLTGGILNKCNTTTLIYKPVQPLGTIKRHIVIVPENAEKEVGFPFWLIKIWNIAINSGAIIVFYASETTLKYIREVHKKNNIECEFREFVDWEDFLILARDFRLDDNLIIVMSRKDSPSYHPNMERIPIYLNKYFKDNGFILIYPIQAFMSERSNIDFHNATMVESIDEITKTISKLLKRK